MVLSGIRSGFSFRVVYSFITEVCPNIKDYHYSDLIFVYCFSITLSGFITIILLFEDPLGTQFLSGVTFNLL